MNVAVIGASPKPHRYSHKAVVDLQAAGHTVFAVTPKPLDTIAGAPVFQYISDISESLDTVTMYVSAAHSDEMTDAILACNPRRLIFNPGAENPQLKSKAEEKGIQVLEACTLVMLSTGQF